MEGKEGQGRVLRKAFGAIRKGARLFVETFNTVPERISLDDIDEKSVCRVILGHLGNPVLENRWANNFSIREVLSNMGYSMRWLDKDPFKIVPEEYLQTRRVLLRLVDEKVLEQIISESHGRSPERLFYKVVDEEGLVRIAKGEAHE